MNQKIKDDADEQGFFNVGADEQDNRVQRANLHKLNENPMTQILASYMRRAHRQPMCFHHMSTIQNQAMSALLRIYTSYQLPFKSLVGVGGRDHVSDPALWSDGHPVGMAGE